MTESPDVRRRELAKIHIAKSQLGIPDDQYRDMLWTIGRVRTSAELGAHGRKQLLDHFIAKGFKPTLPKKPAAPGARMGWEWVNNATPAKQPMLRKIAMLLRDAEREKAYADGVAKHMFHVERIEFCDTRQLHAIVTALVRDQARRGAKAVQA